MARLIPSTREWRQPYLLSNFDLVTESLTLIAGKSSSPFRAMSTRRCTPVVVSSVTPLIPLAMEVHRPGSSARLRVRTVRTTSNSSESAVEGSGTAPAFSNSTPLWTMSVASPPSSRIMLGPPSPGHSSACSVHHQYSWSVSPFQAKTGTPWGSSTVPFGPTATAAAAWSCVEKMLQLHQRTRAPSAVRVSMSTAVCTVMCRDPVTRAPANGWEAANSARMAMRPGISCSASSISLRPKAASERSATLKGSGEVIACSFGLDERARARNTAAGRTAEAQRTCSDLCRRPRTQGPRIEPWGAPAGTLPWMNPHGTITSPPYRAWRG